MDVGDAPVSVVCVCMCCACVQPKDTKYILLARDPTTRIYSIVRDFYGVSKAGAEEDLPLGFQHSAEWFHFFIEEQLRFDCLGLVNKSLEEVPVDPDALLNCGNNKMIPGRGRRPLTIWGSGPAAHMFAQLEDHLYIWFVALWLHLTGTTVEHVKVVRTQDTRLPGTLEGLYVSATLLHAPPHPTHVRVCVHVDVRLWLGVRPVVGLGRADRWTWLGGAPLTDAERSAMLEQSPIHVTNKKAKPGKRFGKMLPKTEALLRAFFAPFNAAFAELMGDDRLRYDVQ